VKYHHIFLVISVPHDTHIHRISSTLSNFSHCEVITITKAFLISTKPVHHRFTFSTGGLIFHTPLLNGRTIRISDISFVCAKKSDELRNNTSNVFLFAIPTVTHLPRTTQRALVFNFLSTTRAHHQYRAARTRVLFVCFCCPLFYSCLLTYIAIYWYCDPGKQHYHGNRITTNTVGGNIIYYYICIGYIYLCHLLHHSHLYIIVIIICFIITNIIIITIILAK
jgi:hypothetical protein